MELNISAESRFLDWDYDYGYMWQDEFFWGGQFFPSYSDAQLRAMFAKAGKDMDIYVDAISKLLVNESLWDDGSPSEPPILPVGPSTIGTVCLSFAKRALTRKTSP